MIGEVSQAALAQREAIEARLSVAKARDLSDAELARCLGPCVSRTKLIRWAKELRDGGLLSGAQQGSIYPIHPDTREGREMSGMTLRDWFAGQCIEQCIRNALDGDGGWDPHNVAYHAYLVADAMLAERAKAEGKQS